MTVELSSFLFGAAFGIFGTTIITYYMFIDAINNEEDDDSGS